MSLLRHAAFFLSAIAVLSAGVWWLMTPLPVQADPHAIFYTATGQQQLFFNILAALDQADYVEPAIGPLSREELKDLRNQTIINEAEKVGVTIPSVGEDPVTESTNTDLSSVLTRAVTLEGSDLFTAHLSREHAIEVSRRAGTALLLNTVFCQLGLGREGCNNSAASLAEQDKAFITDPLKWISFPFTNAVLPTLFSGLPVYQEIYDLLSRDSEKHFSPGIQGDPSIARLHETSRQASPEAAKAAENSSLRALLHFLPPPIDPNLFADLPYDNDGNINLSYKPASSTTSTALAQSQGFPSINDPEFSEYYSAKAQNLLNHDWAMVEKAARAAETVSTTQKLSEADGSVATVQQVPRQDPPSECSSGNCPAPSAGSNATNNSQPLAQQPRIEVPVSAKAGQITAGIQALSDLNTNLRSASPANLQDPTGAVKLLRALEGSSNGNDDGAVEGAQDAGTVLGTSDELGIILERSFGAAPPLGVHQILPQGEDPLGGFLLAIIGESSGCNCKIDDVGNDFGSHILKQVNRSL